MAILYEDNYIVCDDDAITIHMYYFPIGSKRIPYARIRAVSEQPIGLLTGKLRIWGTSLPTYWFNLDPLRPFKNSAIIIDVGDWVKPIITPDNHLAVFNILKAKAANKLMP
jgi:hypothetical protein